jgi:hypothetical protein
MPASQERRKNRSSDPLIALHYQLSHARSVASLETLVLADPSGVVVAGAGSWAACEELAAYAPLLAQSDISEVPRLDAMRSEVEIRQLQVCGQDVFLCARARDRKSSTNGDAAMIRAAEGVSRILSAA